MLPQPIGIFGVHSFTPYSRTDGTPYGILKVINDASMNFSGKTVALTGGSSKFPFAIEEAEFNSELSLKFSEYPDFVYQIFAGMTPTDNDADADGDCSVLTNKQGTSIMNATTGIASVEVISGSEGDLKFGKYVVKAITTTTIQVYFLSDADLSRGTPGTYQDGSLAILASPASITAATATNLTGYGLKLMGGSGTIGLVAGDTATFEVRPKNSGSTIGTIGNVGATFPEFGALIYAKKRGTGEMWEFDAVRCKGEGLPVGLTTNKWSDATVKCMMMYDSSLDYAVRYRRVTPSSAN